MISLSFLTIFLCAGALILLAMFGVGFWLIMQAGQRDTVSSAREGWIQRRSEKDKQEW